MNGGYLQADAEWIGQGGTGCFAQTGGTNTATTALILGYDGQGTYELWGGHLGVGWKIEVGSFGTGTFTQSGSGQVVTDELEVGTGLSSVGTYTLSGAGELLTNHECIGNMGTGSFTQSGGTHTVNYDLELGKGGHGTYELSGGILTVGGQIFVDYQGTFTQNGGALVAGSMSVGSGGTFTFNGGTLQVGTFTGDLVNNGGTLAPGGSVGTTTVDGDYTQLAGGTLAMELGGAAPGTEHDLLAVTGMAQLFGTLKLRVLPGLNPAGLSFTILTSTGGVTGQFSTLDGPIGDVTYNPDSVAVTVLLGDATGDRYVDGLDYVTWANYYMTGDTWEEGDFNGDLTVDGLDYIIWSNNYWAGYPGSPGAVPEPATLALLAIGALGLMRRRRK